MSKLKVMTSEFCGFFLKFVILIVNNSKTRRYYKPSKNNKKRTTLNSREASSSSEEVTKELPELNNTESTAESPAEEGKN